MPRPPLRCKECRLINYQLWMGDPTLCVDARPVKGIGIRPLTPAGASKSQRDISDPCRFRLLLRSSAILAANWCSLMTSTPARSGMIGHFGIRITDADEDELVGELDADDRHLNNSGHVHGGALAEFADDLGGALAGLNVPPGFRTATIESKTNIFRAGATNRRCCTGPCGAAHDRPANLDIARRWKACRNDDSDPDGAPAGVG
jgi:uncharacterized protein (TIGR00369 family)